MLVSPRASEESAGTMDLLARGGAGLTDELIGPRLILGRQRRRARLAVVDAVAKAAGGIRLIQHGLNFEPHIGIVAGQRNQDSRQLVPQSRGIQLVLLTDVL